MKEVTARLFDLVKTAPCDLEEVQAAVRAGADLTAVDNLGQTVVIAVADDWRQLGQPLELLRLLIELGADVNAEDEEGFTALANTIFYHDPAVVACLLEAGANPNAVIERHDTIFDMAETDLDYHEMELRSNPASESDRQACAALTEIVALLKAAGGQRLNEMTATGPRQFIIVAGYQETGMVTAEGCLACEALPGASADFCERFSAWLAAHFDPCPVKSSDSMPADFDRAAHNAEGRRLALEIAERIGPGLEVWFYSINAEREQERGRSVDHEQLQAGITPAGPSAE